MSKLDLETIRQQVRSLHEEGKRIQSHYRRLEKEYSDWEDRLNELDKTIHTAEKQHGLTKEEIVVDNGMLSGIDMSSLSFGDDDNDGFITD